LIVEDDPASLIYLNDSAVSLGHETQTSTDGALGLETFKNFKPDLVLSDIKMPNMDGMQLLKAIKELDAGVIFVMLTAFGSEEYAIKALHLGANNYLHKPIRHTTLIPLLQKYENVIKDRTIESDILGMIIRREFIMKFDNRIDLVPKIVDFLILETGIALKPENKLSIRLGLFELLVNAIEHGNLDITYQEKTEALEKESNQLNLLYNERLSNPLLYQKKVTVEFKMDKTYCEWIISDEGKGFKWQEVLSDDIEGQNLLTHGRGIFLSRLQFDELEYIGRGNVIRVKKLTRNLSEN